MLLLIFFSVFGGLNYYVFRSAAAAYPAYSVFFATIVVLAFLSFLAGRFLEQKRLTKASLPFRWIGATWLGTLGISLFAFAVGDLLQLCGVPFGDRIQFQVTAVFIILAALYGAIAAKRLRINFVEIETEKFPVDKNRIRIVQISDLHLGDSSSRNYVSKVVSKINEQKPDIIVSTGDLFDGYLELLAPYVDLLRELEAPLGKFAISGNHEVYAGLEACMSLTEVSGFKTLRNQTETLPLRLSIIGVEDPEAPDQVDETTLLDSAPEDSFKLFLKHRPALGSNSLRKFDLQLSGHTHGGQIFPFHLLIKLQYRLGHGLKTIADGQQIYISRGTGSWGPQIRFLAPPEITVFDIKGKR